MLPHRLGLMFNLFDLARRCSHFWYTVGHLQHEQVLGRAAVLLKRCLTPHLLPGAKGNLRGQLLAAWDFLNHDSWNFREDLLKGRFRFLKQSFELGCPVDWRHPKPPLLWQFNLHYFNYLHVLNAEEQQSVCREWVEGNPPGSQPGWHPFPTSLRIINWCKAGVEDTVVQQSLYQQAAYLYRDLETHLLGNHLLENARALVFAGYFFEGQGEADDWLEKGLALYREQTPEQILSDGGHFERSPMYHALMLEGYVDVLNLLPVDHGDREWFKSAIERMADYLYSLTHPNGEIVLFNDATQEIALPTDRLLTYVRDVTGYSPVKGSAFPETGHFIHRSDDIYLAIDGGPVGPDYLPAHAHADIFTYELSVGGSQFVVDTGVYDYEAGPMRDYVRSTEAHNTVCIDGVDQAECWAAFRVARRYAPKCVRFDCSEDGCTFRGLFDGYAYLIGDGLTHGRVIQVRDALGTVSVADVVKGSGQRQAVSRIHLHPDVTVVREANRFFLDRDGVRVTVICEAARLRLQDGWYCPEFGKRIKNKVIALEAHGEPPFELTYTFVIS